MDFSIFLTDGATSHFSKLIDKEDKAVFLGVKKSGCSGFTYALNIDNLTDENSKELHIFQSIPFIIKKEDFLFLNDTVIDYKKEGLNYKIIFNNPNSDNECGCGKSFSLKRT